MTKIGDIKNKKINIWANDYINFDPAMESANVFHAVESKDNINKAKLFASLTSPSGNRRGSIIDAGLSPTQAVFIELKRLIRKSRKAFKACKLIQDYLYQ